MTPIADYPLLIQYSPPQKTFLSDLPATILTRIAAMLPTEKDLLVFRLSYRPINRLENLYDIFKLYHTQSFTSKELKQSASDLSRKFDCDISAAELIGNFSSNTEELDLSNCILDSNALISLLQAAPHLKKLILRNNPLINSKAFFFILEKCKELEILDLSGSNPRAFLLREGSQPGRLVPNLKELHLENCDVSNESLEYFCAKCPNIEVLNLSQNQLISDIGVEAIFHYLTKLRE